jgi:hypothetical protein
MAATTYSFRLTAEGWNTFAADMQKLGAESEVAARALDRLRQASPALQTAMERAEAQTQRTTEALQRQHREVETATAGTSRFGQIAGQAGFQIQDFAGQVGAGTSAVTAFAQQFPQFLGSFGQGGAIAGAAVAVGAIAAQFLLSGENAAEAAKRIQASWDAVKTGQEDLGKAIEEVNKLWRTQQQNAVAAAEASRRAISGVLNASEGGVVLAMDSASMELVQARRELQQAQEGIARRQAENFARTGSRVSDADRGDAARLFPLQTRVQGLEQDIGTFTRRLAEIQESQRRLATAPPAGAEPLGPPEPPRGRAEPRSRASAAPRDQEYGPTYDEFLRGQRSLWQEEGRAAQAAQRAEEQAEQRRQQSFDRTVERYSADLAKGTTDALFTGFQNGAGFAESMGRSLERALRTAVASALDAELFRPLISSLFSGMGFTGSTGGAGAGGGMLGGLGQSLGLSGLGGQIRSTFGLDSLGGLGGSIQGFLGTPLWGNPGLQGPTLSGAPLGNGVTIGGAIGGTGAGFGAGMLASSLVGGMRGTVGPGGTIGAGVGTALGFALTPVLGPLGPILGGALGGAGGAMFGPTRAGMNARSGGTLVVGIDANGQLAITDQASKRFDLSEAAAQTNQQLAAINAQIAGGGLSIVGGGNLGELGFGPAAAGREGSIDQIAAALNGRFASSNPRVAQALSRTGGTLAEAAQASQYVTQVYDPLLASLAAAKTPVDQVAEAIKRVTEQFQSAIDQATRYGLSITEITAARDKEIAKIREQEQQQRAALARPLLEQLTFGASSVLSPEARGFAALSSLNAAARDTATPTGLAEYARVAGIALPALRDAFGVSERYGSIVADVGRRLTASSPGSDAARLGAILEAQAGGADRMTEAIIAVGGGTNDLLGRLLTEMQTMRTNIEALARRAA